MPRRILALTLHPAPVSFNAALIETYAEAAAAQGHELRLKALHALQFDADFGQAGYAGAKPLEPDLEAFMADLAWAEHLVLSTPMWWGGLPAKAKGLFDRTFLPGRAFDPRQPRIFGLPKPLLTGKTARVFLTSDTPGIAFNWVYSAAMRKQIERQILGFVGIKPVRFSHFSPVEHSDAGKRQGWLAQARALGRQAA
ncbi:MAG: NAD(P)H-dependent oxidoreductase [Pararhodobacter sp.]